MDEIKLKRELDELGSLRQQLLNELLSEEKQPGAYESILNEYKQLRAEIQLELTKDFTIPKIADPVLREELQAYLKEGDEVIAQLKRSEDKCVQKIGKIIHDQLKPAFEPKREEELASSFFYSWFHPSDYVYRLIETAPIVIKNIDFPEKLQKLIIELRECLIFERYLAAGIMLRTIAEVAVDDILEKHFSSEEFEGLYSKLLFLEERTKFQKPASHLKAYKRELNEYVHGTKLPNRKFINQYINIIFEQVQELYERLD